MVDIARVLYSRCAYGDSSRPRDVPVFPRMLLELRGHEGAQVFVC